jgi:peptide/nickel transport system substrate-binding protein
MSKRHIAIDFLALAALLLVSCNGGSTGTPASILTPGDAAPTEAPTTLPPRQLTVCLGQEPASLYPYGAPSSSARSVLSAIYDGPIDNSSYGYQPVILTKLPSLADGDAQLVQVSVYVGAEIVGADGLPVTLAPGVRVRPAGCRSDSCAVTYEGKAEILMDQMIATFALKPGLEWSDGKPLTAADSVYSYTLAAKPQTPGSKYLVDRTKAYEATGDLTVQWWGKPGFIDPTYFTNFWAPYPEHLWGELPADQLTDADVSARTPVGYGAYVIQEWTAGEQITLTKNPNYFRAAEGLPKFDTLVFRFTPDPETAVSDLLSGACDVLDPGIRLEGQVELLQSLEAQGQVNLETAATPIMEQLAFGIKPASFDAGYTAGVDRPDFFSDKRARQAVAMCLDRQKVVDVVLSGLSSVPTSYLPGEHPLYSPGVTTYAFDPASANQLLESLGWKDADGDPATPRQAWGVTGVLGGTPLELTYVTTGAAQRQQVAQILSESLAQCGIKVNVVYLDAADLFAPGANGVLFGRSFDLAEFAIGTVGVETSCEWFTSAEVPTAANHWMGVNVSGYGSAAFDAACQAARQSLPDEAAYAAAYRDTQSIFADDLPVVPLYWRLKVAASRPGFCNFRPDPTAASALWNIEAFDFGAACNP